MMQRYNIVPPNIFNRIVNGRPAYTPVVVISGADHAHIYVAGRTAMLPDGQLAGVGDLRKQLAQVCQEIHKSLDYVGATLNDVVRTVTYVLDVEAYAKVADKRYRYFTESLPANTLLGISQLAHPDMLIEIEAEAIVPPDRLKNLGAPVNDDP
ncbi:MAG: Rid family hydrolase [Methyloligellaceae bacterium]